MKYEAFTFTVHDIDKSPYYPPIVDVTVENGWVVVWFKGGLRLKWKESKSALKRDAAPRRATRTLTRV